MKKSTLLFGLASAAAGAYAVTRFQEAMKKEENIRKKYDYTNSAIMGAFKGIAAILPDIPRPDAVSYDSEAAGFMEGHKKFITKPAKGAKWSLGYGKVSLIPDDIGIGEYYMGGYLNLPANHVEGLLDDMMFRCFCIDDGSGRGITVFAVIDCVGISSTDIRAIRLLLKDFCKENNIVSINISATHNHSSIDTQGLWGDLMKMLKNNPKAVINGDYDKFYSGRNKSFMEALHVKGAQAIKDAFNDMKPGTLYRNTFEGARYSHDKRPPNVKVNEVTTLYFVPDDKDAKPTRAVYLAAHPVAFGQDNKIVSGDFPYYICEGCEMQGENGIYFQGPQAAVTASRGGNIPEGLSQTEGIQEFGRGIARFCKSLDLAGYEKLEPILNVRIAEMFLPVSNYVMLALAKLQIANNVCLKVGDKVDDIRFVSEVGYCEFGKDLKMALVPGELMPEILLGGAFDAEQAYNHTEYEYPAMKDCVEGYLLGVGLCNDSIGYIVPDNDFGGFTAPQHYEESVSTGIKTAGILVKSFIHLVDACNKSKAD